jgi:hypothetical protein
MSDVLTILLPYMDIPLNTKIEEFINALYAFSDAYILADVIIANKNMNVTKSEFGSL